MKKKIICIAIIGILLLTSSSSLLATGENVKTEGCIKQTTDDISSLNFGNTIYVGGNGPDNYSAIQDAVDSANPGDTVYVYDDSAPYYENIIIDKTLNLIGENKNTTVIDGMMSGDAAIYISAEKVNISGFLINNSHPAGIDIHSKYTNISGNNIFENILCGIICYSNENMIFGNNIISNLVYGIFFTDGSSYNIVLNNNISFNHNGIEEAGSYNTFSDNIITFNDGRGINIGEYGSNTISGNLLSNNLWGIYVHSGNNLFYNNNFVNNYGEGVFIRFAYNNKFFHNNFINNTDGNAVEVNCMNTIWDDGYPSGGNYWNDYEGKDRNGDGIGDTPYYIPESGNKDRYPLMQPWGAPDMPTITGTTHGKPGEEYEYTFTSNNPNGDNIFYYIDWGDDSFEEWVGPFSSGEGIIVTHEWTEKGIYNIRAKAKNTYNLESSWGTLTVTMPRNQPQNQPRFEKNGTIYGPYRLPFLMGGIELTEDATYSSKFAIGEWFCIYRNLKLTGYVHGNGPPHGGSPFQIGNTRLRTEKYEGNATLTIGLWIGLNMYEETGGYNEFMMRLGGAAFNAQLETLD